MNEYECPFKDEIETDYVICLKSGFPAGVEYRTPSLSFK